MGVAGRTHAASGLTSVVRWAIVGYLGAGATIGIVAAAEWSWHVLAGGLLLMAVAVIVGALLGFLFGIPRAASADAQAAGQEPTYRPNTNLEQISDWLTKILVGVGLVQLGELTQRGGDLVDFVAPVLGSGVSGAEPVAAAVLVWGVTFGFLIGYIWTRSALPQMFAAADQVDRKIRDVVSELEDADLQAERLTAAQLEGDESDVPAATLNQAIATASRLARSRVFRMAREQRRRTWRNDKRTMERTIPVFRALIDADGDEEFHRPRGELGFALKDKLEPDWRGALDALDAAIRIRERREEGNWLVYEFNRAVCRIKLGHEADLVVADLRKAGQSSWLRRIDFSDSPVDDWLEEHGLTRAEVGLVQRP